jgi:hypothetical protein
MHQNRWRPRGSAPDPAEGAHDAPKDPLVGWGGGLFPCPRPDRRLDSRACQVPQKQTPKLAIFGE